VRLEKARIKADVIMSISKVFGYSGIVFNKKTKEFVQSYINDFKELSKPVKDSILNGFVDPTYLQIEVYRDIYNELNLKDGVKPREMQVMKDWKKASLLGYGKISPLSDKSKIPSLRMTVDSIKTKKYREPLHLMLDEKMKFGTGDPAIDLTFITPEGTNANLSSLKGKVIYIDIWATWCGPCMAEMPQLETLKEKYAKNNNVSIVSLSVDDTDSIWLRDLEKRNPGGIQFRIERAKLSDYEVLLIPRFILIDKNFNIANMYAPAPSNTELPKIIDNLISK
jgi:thiol-disulfide isomerase/thioredoxin